MPSKCISTTNNWQPVVINRNGYFFISTAQFVLID